MNEAIQQRVEEFVQEILDLVERVGAERREEALSAVTALLVDAGQPPTARASSARRSPASGDGSRKAAAPRRRARTTADTPTRAANVSARDAGHAGSAGSSGTTASTTPRPRSRKAGTVDEANEAAGPASAAAPTTGSASQATEREARVLDAVRDLGNATASEVAERAGLPNGSVVVALRALVARGRVARAKTERGMVYSLPATTAVA
jgi:hypothetical protein